MSPQFKRARSGSYIQSQDMQMVPYVAPRDYVARNGGRATSSFPSYNKSSFRRNRSSGAYAQLSRNVGHVNPRFPPPEIKTLDQGITGLPPVSPPASSNIPAVGGITLINDITAGNTSATRVGLSVVIKSCAYRFEVDLSPTTPVPTSGRVMLIWDRQPNTVTATYADIFSGLNYLAFANTSNMQRFVILRNQQFSLSPNGNQSLFFEGFATINMKCSFSTGLVPASGALLVAFISDQTVVGQQPIISGTWRVRFVDV